MDRFVGAGTPLNRANWDSSLAGLNAPEEALWSVLTVETSGCGFLADRRPKILFERHIFHNLTHGRFDAQDPDISQPDAGGYGAPGAHQYERLQAALILDEEAALASASWGLGQIMGGNYKAAGFTSVGTMVDAFVQSEAAQLAGMIGFIGSVGLTAALAKKNWSTFARIYNGPNYAKNKYDAHLQAFCAQYEARGCPDLALRAAQVMLNYRGYATGGIDGLKGKLTTAALRTFQKSVNLAVTGLPDEKTLAALAAPL